MNTPTALSGLESCNLHRRSPYGITNVSHTHFSIARYYGGCTVQGAHYTYLPATDELIRTDVLKWQRKQHRTPKLPPQDTPQFTFPTGGKS